MGKIGQAFFPQFIVHIRISHLFNTTLPALLAEIFQISRDKDNFEVFKRKYDSFDYIFEDFRLNFFKIVEKYGKL